MPNENDSITEIAPVDSSNGQIANGHATNGNGANGNGANGHSTNGSATEIVAGSGDLRSYTPKAARRKKGGGALAFARRFTTAGQDVFETVEWDRRTAAITGEDGKAVFEQKDCEIPRSWSQLATNVVVSKYFRGPLGTPRRETSVRQVIGRVADTMHRWGVEGNYFASSEDAQAFRDELAYLLLHQYGSFNSPVWFNIGVPEAKQQASACFINSVHDNMESIMELAATEARLFKGGSGAGTNMWRIRSSREQLSGGGIASGPVSFMRGWDAFAGAIKSGGTTRRAAKMVILNSDHPDIEEFITCKAQEEKKAWALIDAGYPGGFNVPGGAYDSVDFQNANHSVRVTDAFMRAAENNMPWTTRAVMTGEPVESKSGKEMLHKIAEATHICGDPGLQYDTTINDWHTCSNTDRIYASNPCSEYLFLDDSACNLASLNLMKYRSESGEFDVESFIHASETFITAQEIIVSNASYPTEKIARNSEDYRPLGLGYANLGALLMAQGTAYDSDEGRALAGSITAVMTGAAYRQSARIAANIGPFNGYAKNREPMLRVIGKHRDAVNDIPHSLVPPALTDAAHRVWDEALMLGQKHGYRNAQSTVLAPTGCLVGESLVATDRGLVRLETLGNPNGERWQKADFGVQTDDGPRRATKFFINGMAETRRIRTQAGYAIQGTLKHRIKVVDAASGEWVWKRFAEVGAGDVVPLAMNGLIGEAQSVTLPPLGDLHWNGDFQTRVPRVMSPELAELVGYFMGDGSLHAKGLRLCVAQGDDDVAARLVELARELFGLQAHLAPRQGYTEVSIHSVALAIWWDACGFGKTRAHESHSGKGWTPRVPNAVLHSNDARVYGAFLRGLYEADGTLSEGVPSLSTSSDSFAGEARSILLILGFPTTSKSGVSGWGGNALHGLRLRNISYNARFRNQIGFIGARKNGATLEVKDTAMAKRDRIPLPADLVNELAPCGHPLRDAMLISLRRHGAVSRLSVMTLFAHSGDERLRHALDFFYDAVQSNEDGGERMTFDLSVPSNVTYVANGFVSHNTIAFMMDCDTTGIEPDIALVKYKKLVGGGLLKIVNQTVPEALRRLGYSGEETDAVIEYIDKNDTIEGAPALRDDDLSVFDCAFKAMNGTRSIQYMGHVKMMAAAQPFISGAISKCVTGDTLIASTEGIFPIGSLYRGEKPGEFSETAMTLASIGAPQNADLFYYGGLRPTKKAVMGDGRTIEGTWNHRVKVANTRGYGWKSLEDLENGDFVSVRLGAEMWAAKDADLLAKFAPSPHHTAQKRIALPSQMSPLLARFLGFYIAEGNKTASNYVVRITNNNPLVLEQCLHTARDLFGLGGRIETDKRNGVTSFVVASKTLCEFLDHIGAGGDSSTKQIPWSVLRSTRECVAEFIGGLWLDGYVRKDGMTAICLNSPQLLRQLQVVLNNFGLRAHIIRKYNAQYQKHFDELGMHGRDARAFAALFRLDDAHKTVALEQLCAREKRVSSVYSDVIPAFKSEIQAFVKARRDTQRFRHIFDARTRHLSFETVQTLADFYGEELLAAIPDLREILENNIHFVALREVSDEYSTVFDFQVPSNHAFLGNGIVNHNTVNMPPDSTVDEIMHTYIEAWKLGLKAVAIYRDGSKRTQPLSTSTDAMKADALARDAVRALRRKLPDERQAITHKFSIAGQEGYFTVGLYEDGSPGEIFIKMSKEGSTISGLMDSFAVAISMSLQYGVPLRVLVNKFTHTRFEPSGYTTNKEIPIAKSLMDYIFRWFDLKFHPNGDNGFVGKEEPLLLTESTAGTSAGESKKA